MIVKAVWRAKLDGSDHEPGKVISLVEFKERNMGDRDPDAHR